MSNGVFNIAEDREGNIWWSSFRGLTKYDGQKATHYYLAEANYTKLYIDSKQRIWTASNKEIVKIEGEHMTSFDFTKMMTGSRVATIFEDKEGNMWFGLHRGGVLKYDGKKFLQYTKPQGLRGKSVYSIVQDDQGSIWFGTDKGLVKYSHNKFSTYTTKEGLSGDFIIKIMQDDQKNLWLGTYKSGLMKFNPNFFYQQYLQGENNKDIVRSFHEDAQGVLWAITRNSGLLRITQDTVQTISLDNPDVGLIAYSLATDKQRNLWVGVKGGVIKYSAKECLYYPLISPDRYMTALSNDRDHNVWMETYQGIMKFDGKQFIEYPLAIPSSTTKIMTDTKGHVWVASGRGLYKIAGNQAILYTPKEGLSSSVITSLLEDSHGHIWIGTYTGGLMHFDGQTFTYYTTKQGLPSNFIKSIVEDQQKNLWLGTEKGLSLMQPQFNSPQHGKQAYTIINYGHEDGLESINFEPRAAILDKENKLWWGTGKKVVSLDLDNFQVSQKAPQIHLRQLDINGTFINFRLLPDSLKSAITFSGTPVFENYPLDLTLDHNHRHIKLHFSALSNDISKKIKYSYRIKDQGKQWSQPSEQPFVEYQNLPFGSHTFQVKAIGDAQMWSKIVEYTFVVKPPLWQSKGFILLYVISCIALVVVYIRWNLARLVKKQQLLEQKVADRTFNLNQAIHQLNQLNLDLKNSKAEVIQLKEKEKKIFTDQIKQREDEMLLIMKTINERLYKANAIKDELFVAIKKRSDKGTLSAAKDLAKFLESVSDLDILTERIEEKYPGMLTKIKVAYPDLSTNDVRHCLYIRLNLTLKEVAQLHNVSISAVKTARNRLRRKMGIPKETSLKCFIQSKF
jgi:ligand-binding sensor domain-containing protein